MQLVCAGVRNLRIRRASLAVLNFTLQFIPPAGRFAVLRNLYDGMLPGGVLVLSEKVHFAEKGREKLHQGLHHAFKRARGYSATWKSAKSAPPWKAS